MSKTAADSLIARTFSPERELELEEDSAVTNVYPSVVEDNRGNFLIADFAESQVRRYDRYGHLLRFFGHRGSGLHKFPTPLTAVLELPSGQVGVAEFTGRITVLDTGLTTVLGQEDTGILPLYSVHALPNGLLLLGGRASQSAPYENPALLHLWNFAKRREVKGFFPPPVSPRFASAGATLGIVATAVHGDTIAATFALTDTVYLFNLDGQVVGRVPIPFKYFDHIRHANAESGDVQARARWLSEISQITDVYWLQDGRFLIQYFTNALPEQRFGLLGMTSRGTLLFDIGNSPRLVTVTDSAGRPTFYFEKPGKEAARTWLVDRFIRQY